jgi:hypothetical protein
MSIHHFDDLHLSPRRRVVVVLGFVFNSEHDSASLNTPPGQLLSSRRLVHAIREFGFARSFAHHHHPHGIEQLCGVKSRRNPASHWQADTQSR